MTKQEREERRKFLYEQHCVGSSCPKKKTCQLYYNTASLSRYWIRPPYTMKSGTFNCLSFEQAFGDKVINDIKDATE